MTEEVIKRASADLEVTIDSMTATKGGLRLNIKVTDLNEVDANALFAIVRGGVAKMRIVSGQYGMVEDGEAHEDEAIARAGEETAVAELAERDAATEAELDELARAQAAEGKVVSLDEFTTGLPAGTYRGRFSESSKAHVCGARHALCGIPLNDEMLKTAADAEYEMCVNCGVFVDELEIYAAATPRLMHIAEGARGGGPGFTYEDTVTSFCGVRHLKEAVVSHRLAEVTSFEGVLVCRSCVLTGVVRYPGLRGEFQTLGVDFEDGSG